MTWTERSLTSRLGVALDGVQADGDLSGAELDRIRQTVFAHGVLLLPGQALSDDALFAFAEAVGEVVPTPNISGAPQDRVLPLTNLDDQGRLRPPEDMWVRRNQANEQWHADLTFMRPRASISILYGRTVTTALGILSESVSSKRTLVRTKLIS